VNKMRRFAALPIAMLILAACQGGGTGGSPSAADGGDACADAPEGDLLATICEAGTIRVATDPAYPPQSELLPDGTFEGFDIDVANEIGERLGVEVQFETPNFDEVVAGSWAGRFDISVGSVTITSEREGVLDFTAPYYYTPAQMLATEASGITDLEGLAGMTVCVGEATTYQSWLEGALQLAGGSPDPTEPPDGVEVTTFSTDTECADAVAGGRTEFEGWLTSSTTAAAALADGAAFVEVGDPVFFEALAVATDKAGPAHDALQAALDQIVAEMHEDGTLSGFSETWFDGLDLTVTE
jgi:polar amino acid transport system substrate-binding protein